METDDKTLTLFSTRIRQLILSYQESRQENAELYTLLQEQGERIKRLEKELAKSTREYESLKIAKMIEVTDSDMESAQKRLSKLIRDVNKCITLLSEESS